MKNFILKCSVLTVLIATLCAAGYGIQELRSGDGSIYRTGSVLTMETGSTLSIGTGVNTTLVRQIALGTPAAPVTNYFVTSVDKKVGNYTLATNAIVPPRNLTVGVSGTNSETAGSLTITGLDAVGQPLTETVAATNGALSTKAFKNITSIAGSGWVRGTNDATTNTIVIGTGAKVGLPVALPPNTATVLTSVGTSLAVSSATSGTNATTAVVPISTVSPASINGTNAVIAYPAY